MYFDMTSESRNITICSATLRKAIPVATRNRPLMANGLVKYVPSATNMNSCRQSHNNDFSKNSYHKYFESDSSQTYLQIRTVSNKYTIEKNGFSFLHMLRKP
jgi:hypothetical protein